MRWLRNLNIHNKLLFAFAILTLAAALSSSWSILSAVQLRQMLVDSQNQAAYLEQTAAAQTDFQGLVVMWRNYWLSGSPFYLGQANRYQQQIDLYLRRAWAASQTPDEREDINSLKSLLAGHITSLEQISGQQENRQPGTAGPQNSLQAGLMTEDTIRAADQAANLALIQLENMTTKHGLKLAALNKQIEALGARLVFAGLISLFLLCVLALVAAQTAQQVAEPLLHLTNAVVSFENNTFQAGQLEPYERLQNELGQLARAFSAMATSIIESLRLKDQFIDAAARFVPTQYLDLLEKDSIIDIKLGDHVSAEMAVMFSDVRGFTTLSEHMTPQQNFDFVNDYLEMVSPIIQRHDGFIVKFLGDGMMAIFPYGTDSAVRAGIEKQLAIQKFNADLARRGLPSIEIGIGIHTGHMMVGMVGEELRMQGDAFSDTVNLTARIEGLNKYFGTAMIISAETLLRLQPPVRYHKRSLGRVEVKGRRQPIELHEIYDGQDPQSIAAKAAFQDEFERGLKAYQAGRFAQAREHFASVLRQAPDDRAAALYARRVESWLGKAPPEDWAGVEVMEGK